MFIPHLEVLEKAVEDNDLKVIDSLLQANSRVQNKTQTFKSALMLSAHKLNHLLKIDSLESDCIMLNLEDGVSVEQKPMALKLAAFFLSKIPQSTKKFVVRVNAIDEGGLDEIKFLNPYRPDAIRIAKVRSLEDVIKVLEVLDENIELHLSIETKEAYNNLRSLQYKGRVKAVYLGVLDLLADLGLEQSLLTLNNPTIEHILCEFLLSAKIINAYPVSFVYQDYKNIAEFQRWVELEKRIGFTSKGCVSPTQAQEAMKSFTPDDEQVHRARYIIELFEKMKKQGVTGFSDEKYGFIDEPIYKGALKTIAKK